MMLYAFFFFFFSLLLLVFAYIILVDSHLSTSAWDFTSHCDLKLGVAVAFWRLVGSYCWAALDRLDLGSLHAHRHLKV
jgi:uncharacterized membrane protein YczE